MRLTRFAIAIIPLERPIAASLSLRGTVGAICSVGKISVTGSV
ncbi:hypothetical protein [Pseudonocardia thermophila]|nr:hypothetical protein [Pseudonocardia thermophila]